MEKKKTKLPKSQQHIVDDLLLWEGSFVQVAAVLNGSEFNYTFAKPLNLGLHTPLYRLESIWNKGQDAIECLIRKKILVPDLSNKEFAIQVALGTMTYRIYRLTKEYK